MYMYCTIHLGPISLSRSFSCSKYPARSPQSEREPLLPSSLPSRFPCVRRANENLLESTFALAKAHTERGETRRGGHALLRARVRRRSSLLRRGGKMDRRTAPTKPRGISFFFLQCGVRGDLRWPVSVQQSAARQLTTLLLSSPVSKNRAIIVLGWCSPSPSLQRVQTSRMGRNRARLQGSSPNTHPHKHMTEQQHDMGH